MPTTAALCLRNHDAERAYELTVRVTNLDDLQEFERTYTLEPEDVRAARALVPPGRYAVAVAHDGAYPETVTTRLSEHPADTVLVECGNGIVSVTADPF